MEKILKFSGEGHSMNIQTEIDERIQKLGIRANVSRVVCNMGRTEANAAAGRATWVSRIHCAAGRGPRTFVARTSTGNSSLCTRQLPCPFQIISQRMMCFLVLI